MLRLTALMFTSALVVLGSSSATTASGSHVSDRATSTSPGVVVVPTTTPPDPIIETTVAVQPTTEPSATTVDPTATTIDPTATTIGAATTTVDPTATTLDPTATTLDPTATTVDPAATTIDSVETTVVDVSTTGEVIPDSTSPPTSAAASTTVVREVTTNRPSAAPQVRNSDIPIGSIILAVFVLAGVGLASYLLARRSPGALTSGTAPEVPRTPLSDAMDAARSGHGTQTHAATLNFLLALGRSLIDAGDAVSHVESTLRTVARVNGIAHIGVVVLPTALIVSLPGDTSVTTEVSAAGGAPLRLDQIDDVLRLVQAAERGDVGAAEGRQRLTQIRTSEHPYAPRLAVLGYVCSTVGLAVILRATWREVLLAAALGAVIGSFRMSTRRLGSSYQPFVPLIAATVVSISVFSLARVVDDLVTFPLLVAPLITFLPGALLTIGVLELATGHVVSGASRLASGVMQLVLVALGLVAGRQLVGVPATTLRHTVDGPFAVLAPWVGVAVFGVGVVWFNGARTSARSWIVLVLYVAYSGQVIGGLFFGSALSAFFGALAMTPVALFAARHPSGPTPLVAFLPGFWILVPGALGLEGVTRLLDGGPGAGALVTTVTSMIGISLGILLGLTLASSDPEHPWAETRVRRER